MINLKSTDVFPVLEELMLVDGFPIVLDLEKSHGVWMADSKSGDEYLDFFSFFASNPVGINHPKLMTGEFLNKLNKVAVNKPSNSDLYTIEMAECVAMFKKIAIPDFMEHLFFISGGALAVENALKVAFDWKQRKNGNFADKDPELKIIHFKEAFHGRSGYTMSLTNTDPAKTDYFPKFNWPRIDNPKITFPLEGVNLENVIKAEENSINQLKDAILKDKENIAALILEPIQGEGGDNHFRPEFFKKLREITLENDIMFILDEIQTGMGLTGKMWAHEYYGIKPDIMAFGKKTQVCGILCNNRVDEVKENVFKTSSRINSTWGGNLVDMVRFTKYLEIIDEENLVENAAIMGAYLLDNLKTISKEYDQISNVRGKGLMIAFDFESHESRIKFKDILFKNKIMVLPCGPWSIRFRPALNISKDEIDIALDATRKTLKEMY
ncbi:L-lysine 6-transaminase [candidate division KSB1 bacterium]